MSTGGFIRLVLKCKGFFFFFPYSIHFFSISTINLREKPSASKLIIANFDIKFDVFINIDPDNLADSLHLSVHRGLL